MKASHQPRRQWGVREAWPLLNKIWPQGGERRRWWPPRLKLGPTNTIFLAPALPATDIRFLK